MFSSGQLKANENDKSGNDNILIYYLTTQLVNETVSYAPNWLQANL